MQAFIVPAQVYTGVDIIPHQYPTAAFMYRVDSDIRLTASAPLAHLAPPMVFHMVDTMVVEATMAEQDFLV
jgi:hypothetical protein